MPEETDLEYGHTWIYEISRSEIPDIYPEKIEFNLSGEIDLTEICHQFECYLRAVGFSFDGTIRVIEEEEDAPSDPNRPRMPEMQAWQNLMQAAGLPSNASASSISSGFTSSIAYTPSNRGTAEGSFGTGIAAGSFGTAAPFAMGTVMPLPGQGFSGIAGSTTGYGYSHQTFESECVSCHTIETFKTSPKSPRKSP